MSDKLKKLEEKTKRLLDEIQAAIMLVAAMESPGEQIQFTNRGQPNSRQVVLAIRIAEKL